MAYAYYVNSMYTCSIWEVFVLTMYIHNIFLLFWLSENEVNKDQYTASNVYYVCTLYFISKILQTTTASI